MGRKRSFGKKERREATCRESHAAVLWKSGNHGVRITPMSVITSLSYAISLSFNVLKIFLRLFAFDFGAIRIKFAEPIISFLFSASFRDLSRARKPYRMDR